MNTLKRILAVLFLSLSAFAQEKPVTIAVAVFGDYYAVISHHDPRAEGKNGFWLRRGYVTFDRALSDSLSARLRFEVNQPGDFRTSATLEPFVKDVYVKWRSSPALEVLVGISPNPGFDHVERVWGYRHVEKTPLDLHRIAPTRDLGLAVQGAWGRTRYHVIAGNGSGTGSETNEEKRVAGAVSLVPLQGMIVELYADREGRPGDADRTTVQLFGGVEKERYRAGLQYAHQVRDDTGDLDIASVFAVYHVNPRFSLLGRVDRLFDPNPEGDRIAYLPFDPTEKATTLIAGIDWKLHRHLSVVPNVEYVRYDGDAEDDFLPRVTFYFTF